MYIKGLVRLYVMLVEHLKKSLENAIKGVSRLDPEVLEIDGESGKLTRHFYNNLLNIEDARYLEIGVYKGSSVCSAMSNNKATVVCVDDWSEWLSSPRDEFFINFNKFKGDNDARFIEADCFSIDISTLPKFNMYTFDGPHGVQDHSKALSHFIDCLDDEFIFVVDDWNWECVRVGTLNAIRTLHLNVLYKTEIRTTPDNSHVRWGSSEQQNWHNGIFMAVLQKPV
jgi:hypothetical protein